MISSVCLKNFLSFEGTLIKFHPGITVFVGESFAGKSNIIRAIEELIIQPGNNIIRAGKKSAYLSATINEVEVKRTKSSKQNSYVVGDMKFGKVGRHIPSELQELANLAWLDGSCISISKQTGKRFLIDETSSAAAKHLASISGLDRLFKAIETADRDQKRTKQKIEFTKEEIESIKETCAETKQVLQYAKQIKQLKQIDIQIDDLEEEIDHKKSILSKQQHLQEQAKELELRLSKADDEIERVIRLSNICPLSKGEFFESCKERILHDT